jgi:hypothetical protein
MPTLTAVVEHYQVSGRSGYRYQFTPKHHGADKRAAQWLPTLSLEEEFAVFNAADKHELRDDEGRLYGVEKLGKDGLRDLGTLGQQVAEFPCARAGDAWHGYPLWPLDEEGPSNRRGHQMRPALAVFHKMVLVGLLTHRERKRLLKGDHV